MRFDPNIGGPYIITLVLRMNNADSYVLQVEEECPH